MADDVRIALLMPADLADYKRLRDGMLAGHEQAFSSDAAQERGRDAASYQARLHAEVGGRALFTLGAWMDGRLVGALTCEREARGKARHQAQLVGMMVDDMAQGRGLGRRLLQTALALLRRDPSLEMVTLSVTATNKRAYELYRRAGFVRYGRLPRALRMPDGRYLAKDLMVCDLRPAALE